MVVLFLTMTKMLTIDIRGIYTDLMRKFHNEGHELYIVSPSERRYEGTTQLIEADRIHILSVKTLNVVKTNVIEKGAGQLSIEYLYKRAIKKYFGGVKFDLVLYSTPPITFTNVIKYVKLHNPRAMTYLLLKDIFPQNAVDMGMMSKAGAKGLLYKFFRYKEKKLYSISDFIGCMSPANVKYVLEHNPEINPLNVEIAPNSIELVEQKLYDKKEVLKKYGLPIDKPIIIYGGNLGVPQGIPFLIECLKANQNRNDCHFVIVGNGTYYSRLEKWYLAEKPTAITLMQELPKDDYDHLVGACHVGMIFLDYHFSIPNFPSRLLSYLENRMPVVICTDVNCDMGNIAEENGFGIKCLSNSVKTFTETIDKILNQNTRDMGEKGYEYLKQHYVVENTYSQIIKHIS